jgi:putative glutamine amidotransferase
MRLVSAIYSDYYPFDQLPIVKEVATTTLPAELKKGDLLVVWGGADISPTMYNRAVGKYTGADSHLSKRDHIEWELMKRAKELNIPIIGVCRGAQMLCALAGGFLIQHVEKHSGQHVVLTIDGEELITNSIHHQMMYPWGVDHKMLASIKTKLSKVHLDVDTHVDIEEEPEYVYFPKVKGFAVQWHPEMMRAESPATQFVFKTILEELK